MSFEKFVHEYSVTLFLTAKKWIQPKWPLIDEWINKMYIAIQRNIAQQYKGTKYWHILQHVKKKQVNGQEPDTQEYILHDSTFTKCPENTNSKRQKVR